MTDILRIFFPDPTTWQTKVFALGFSFFLILGFWMVWIHLYHRYRNWRRNHLLAQAGDYQVEVFMNKIRWRQR